MVSPQPTPSIPLWPDVASTVPTHDLSLLERVLRQQLYSLLARLWSGNFSQQDEADLRACYDAMANTLKHRAYHMSVYSAISADGGKSWNAEGVECLPDVSVPHYVGLPDGKVKAVALDYDVDNIIAHRGVAGRLVLFESEDGVHFTRDPKFRVIDIYVRNTLDPDIALLPDGSLRIYYLVPTTNQVAAFRQPLSLSGLSGCFLSAISRDGHIFYQEPGVRYDNPFGGIDPTIFKMGGSKWGLYSHVFQENIIVGATSSDDGMTFTANEGGFVFRGMLVNVRPVSGGFRMWYREPGRPPGTRGLATIWEGRRSAFSQDGVHWDEEVEFSSEGLPNIFKLPDGRMRMYYLARNVQA